MKAWLHLLLAVWAGAAQAGLSFQAMVDITPAGGTLRPPPGVYAAPVVVSKPIIIDGGGKVTLDAIGAGSMLTLNAGDSQIRGLILKNTGQSHDRMDAAITVTGNHNRIEDNTIDNALFGIHLRQANNNLRPPDLET